MNLIKYVQCINMIRTFIIYTGLIILFNPDLLDNVSFEDKVREKISKNIDLIFLFRKCN